MQNNYLQIMLPNWFPASSHSIHHLRTNWMRQLRDALRRQKAEVDEHLKNIDDWFEEMDTLLCKKCSGSGSYTVYDQPDDRHSIECDECNGTGFQDKIARPEI